MPAIDLSPITNRLDGIDKRLAKLPTSFPDIPSELRKTVAAVDEAKLAADLKRALGPLRSAAGSVGGFVDFLERERAGFEKAKPGFQKQLQQFAADVRTVAARSVELLTGRTAAPESSLVSWALGNLPDPLLLVLYQGLDPIPLWREAPAEIAAVLSRPEFPSLADLADRKCDKLLSAPDLHAKVERASLATGITIKVLDLAIRHLPKDLTVEVTVFGGGGLTIATHPFHVVFTWSKWALEMAQKLFEKYLSAYKSCADERAAEELARWRADVTASLTRIEAAIAAGR